MNIQQITKQILEEHKTINKAEEKKKIKELLIKIDKLLKKNKVKARIKLGGSAAKDTFLGNDFDVDIFIMFNYNKYLDKDISKILGKCIKSLKPVKVHGSRDYYQINKRYEIIPVLEIKNPGKAVNVTDASTLHVDWVKKSIKNKAKLKSEIRLAKLFFKGINIYGAESYIKGVSGHVTDILVIFYGSFSNMIKAISKWKDSTEIDIENHKTVLDKSKIQGPLVIVDPIQPNRNAAAALNREKYDLLKKKTKEFLKKPSIKFFHPKKIEISKLKSKYNLIIKVKQKKGKKDIVGAKLMKGYEFIAIRLKDFGVEKSSWIWDEKKCYYYFKLKDLKLSKFCEKRGPMKEFPAHVKRFKQKYRNTYLKKGTIYAKAKRDITSIDESIKNISKDNYLKDKIGGIKIVK